MPFYCLLCNTVGRKEDEQLLALRGAERGAQALLALQGGPVLRRCVPRAAWKGHKTSCVTLDEVFEKVNAAHLHEDWQGMIKLEGRMEQMMEYQPDAECHDILQAFATAHREVFNSTGSKDNSLSIVRLETRRAGVLGKMQRFRDQGEALCLGAEHLLELWRRQEAEGYFEQARKIAEAHGFFSVECRSCLGLGKLATAGGRQKEGVELLLNALACLPLCEEESTISELMVLPSVIDALFDTHAIDEVEPLVARFLEAAKAESQTQGRLFFPELQSLYTSARLHEVLCTRTPRVGPPSHCSAFAIHPDR